MTIRKSFSVMFLWFGTIAYSTTWPSGIFSKEFLLHMVDRAEDFQGLIVLTSIGKIGGMYMFQE
jgi:hypothetical protein